MDCLGVEVPVLHTRRAKRERKLSLSLCRKTGGMEQTVDAFKEGMGIDGVDCGETGSLLEHQLPARTLLSPEVSLLPRKTLLLKAPSAVKRSPPQKQAAASRRRRAQDKKYLQENGTITVPGEPTKIAMCETFFMPVSKKRKLLAEENNTSKTNQGTKRPIEEALKDVPTEVVSMKAKPSGPPPSSPKGKITPKAFSCSSQDSESVLRVKGVLDVKEDAHRSAGKPLHPLFLRSKASATKILASSSELGYLEPCPPAHVTQCLKEEKERMWEDASFDITPPSERCKEEELVHRLMQSGHSLRDDLLMSRSSIPTPKKMESLSKSYFCSTNRGAKHCDVYQASSTQQELGNLLEYLQQSTKPRRKLLGTFVPPLRNRAIDDSNSIEKLEGRLSWYNARHNSLVTEKDKGPPISQKNMLWTDMYQPRSSKEVCGNTTGVESLNNWLQSWRERMLGQVNGPDLSQKNTFDRRDDLDSDRGWFEDDSDIDTDTDTDEDDGLHSTLLVTGPTGCGKTAAIYACAAEQELTVLEVNASSCRSGASVMQKFGRGGLESQAMGKWSSFDDHVSSAKETDSSRTLPHSRCQMSPQVSGTGKKGRKTGATSGGKHSRGPLVKGAVRTKLFDTCASNCCEENLGVIVEEPQPGGPQKKMTIILFEDVDLQFEEDRGFLTSLVQLAKKTKRPLILTSNSRQPGLPQVLEKARIDFCYPSPEELTLHATMVCIAEGVSCSPWMVNRMVESCHCDMRKVIMSLQFWRQDTFSSLTSSLNSSTLDFETSSNNVQDISERCVSGDLGVSRRRLSLSPCLPPSQGLSVSPGVQNRLVGSDRANAFKQWDSEARYLYELDIHHIILPDVFSSNWPCLLSLDVASRINAAVSELEKHESMVAAKDAEQQGLALQHQLNAAEAQRKAWRKAKDATRKASHMTTKLHEEEPAILGVSSKDDTECESAAVKSQFTVSPVKSTREARAFARSPLRAKLLKQRLELLLCDSHNCEGQAAQGQADGLSGVSDSFSGETRLTEVQGSSEATPADLENNDHVEDRDAMVIASCESVAVKRNRLQQDLERDLPDGRHSVTGSTQRDENVCVNAHQLTEHLIGLESINLNRRYSKLNGEEAKFRSERVVVDVDLNVASCPEDSVAVEDVYANNVSTCVPEERQLLNAVDNSCGLVDSAGSKVNRVSGGDHTSGLSSDEENVTAVEKTGCVEMTDSTSPLCPVKLSEDVEADDITNVGVFEETRCDVFNPVLEAWKKLRDELQAPRHLLRPVQSSLHESEALAALLDVISASNTISSFPSESWKTAQTTFSGTWNGALEGNIGHCSLWESCQEIASQLVRAGLQSFSIASLVTCRDKRLPVAVSILAAAKDVPAVGKCIITCDDVKSVHNLASQLKSTENAYSKEEIIRQSEKLERLDEIIRTRLLPKGRIAGVSLIDYIAYLARINQLEEERRTQITSNSRRSRRFQHHLSSKMSDTDIAEFDVLCRFVKA